MSRQAKILMGIGAVIAAVVVGALMLVMSDPAPPVGGDDSAAVEPREVAPTEAGEKVTGTERRRARVPGGAALFGIVQHAADEKPAAGQAVRLVGETIGALEVLTDESGAFRLASLPAGGPYALEIDAEGFAPIRLPGIALDRSEERDLGKLLLDLAVRVEVHVRDIAGEPLEGARVFAYASPEFGWGFDWSKAMAQAGQEPVAVATVDTAADGMAVFDELAAGSWTFLARKDGYAATGKASIRLRSSQEPDPVTLHLERGYTLSGRVLDESDAPVAGALILGGSGNSAWNVGAAPLRVRAVSGEDGTYALSALRPGDTAIFAAPAGATPAQIVMLRIPDVSKFDIHLRAGGTLTGRVTVKETGAPVEGAKVRAMSWGISGSRMAEAVTDAEGRYTIEDLPEGNVGNFTVEKDGMVQVQETNNTWQPTPFRRGERVEKDLELEPGAAVTGTVTGPDGPVGGARVMVMGRRGAQGFDQKQATTDAEGHYRVDALGPGKYIVQAAAPGLYTPDFPANWWMAIQSGRLPEQLSGEAVAGEESVTDIVLKPGTTISGRVETAEGEPVAGAGVRATSNGGFLGGNTEPVVTGEDGSFRIEGVVPAPQVSLSATKSGLAATRRDPIVVTAGEPVEGELIVMRSLPVVRGTVTAASGALPEDAFVQLFAAPDRGNMRGFDPSMLGGNAERHPVRRDGTYEITIGFVQGSFTVSVGAPGHPSVQSERITLEDGRTEYVADVQIGAGHSLSGRVSNDMTNEPIAGAHVRVSSTGGGNALQQEIIALDGALTSWGGGGGGGGGAVVVAISDESGVFRVTGLAPGNQKVSAAAEGFVQGTVDTRTPFTGEVSLPLAPELEISGRVQFGTGEGVGGVMVMAASTENANGGAMPGMVPMGGGGSGANATTDANGVFVLRGLARGQYVLSVRNNWGGTANVQPFQSQPTAAGAVDITLTVQKGLRIAGRIVDDAGEPVTQCWIWANAVGKPGQPVNAQAKPDGTFEIVGLPNDVESYNVTFNAQRMGGGYAPLTLEKVKPGTTGLEVVMPSGLSIEGKITDGDGKPFANAWVMAQPIAQEGEPSRRGGNGTVDADGSFSIGGLEPGRYSLSLQTFGAGQSQQMVLEGGQDVAAGTADLRLTATAGATISGIVVDSSGQRATNVNVRANPTEGGRGGFARTNADGEFEIAGLVDGKTYDVSVQARGKFGSQVGAVSAGTSGLRLEIHAGVTVDGVAYGSDGEPLARAWIYFRAAGDEPGLSPQTGRADEEGRFTVSGLAEGAIYKAQARVREAGTFKSIDLGTVTGGQSGVELRAD